MRAAPPREWKPLEEAVPRDVFQAEVEAWAKCIGVHPRVVQVRPMKRKWGSCSTAGRVSFDTTLLRQHAEFRKRVIAEELLHRLGSDPLSALLPKIVLSEDSDPRVHLRLRAAGAHQVAQLPLDVRAFVDAVGELLRRRTL